MSEDEPDYGSKGNHGRGTRYRVVAGQNDLLLDNGRVLRIPPGDYVSGQAASAAAVDAGPDSSSARPVTPADQALETLALIAEHRLTLYPYKGHWLAGAWEEAEPFEHWNEPYRGEDRAGEGAAIGDAVRACVARIKRPAGES